MFWNKPRFKQWWWPLGVMMAIEGTPAQQATAWAHNKAHRYLALVTLGHWALATASAFGLGVLFEGLGLPVVFPALCFIAMAIGCAVVFWAFAVFLLLSAPDQDP